ncbi:hypothetical protein CR205_12455 [Alteribacter lacisalsi]|uniref:Uncharacterized protein n=1 Tax=Alteribacter lacisalsi TaxID=2045244 RepID=A0A2W0H6C4_9BACI|nr:hypothetical protein [Alteribacter lacisalsi]PYZ96521.1 hypothetical protein CR205_12455 [Alteribacter lacisalsi]
MNLFTAMILSAILFFTAYMLGVRKNLNFLTLFILGMGERMVTGDREKVCVRFAWLAAVTGALVLIHAAAGEYAGSALTAVSGAIILSMAVFAFAGLLKYGFRDHAKRPEKD